MPLLEGEPVYTGGESWQTKFAPPPELEEASPAPYHAWHRTWHLHPGLTATGQFETTAPVPSSVLLTRPWDLPAMRTETASGPMGWKAAYEGISVVSNDPWPFELDARNGKLKCLACCASARGDCGLDTCGLKPPPVPQEFLARGGGEGVYRPPLLAPQPQPGSLGHVQDRPLHHHGQHHHAAGSSVHRPPPPAPPPPPLF